MENQEHAGNAPLSKAATRWFYIALVFVSLFYAFLLGTSGYGLSYEPGREFFMYCIIMLASVNGFIAVVLTLRRKLYGAYWSFAPAVLVCLSAVDVGYGSTSTSTDFIPLIVLLSASMALLLSQIPTLKKLKKLGPGWGLGTMAYTNPRQVISRVAVWWFRVVITLSCLFYLGVFIGSCGMMISDPPRVMYSLYMAIIAGACGLFAVLLTFRKEIFGVFWGLMPCIFLGLGTTDIGFGKPLRHFTSEMLPPTIFLAILLLSQIPYLKKLQKMGDRANFQKRHFTNGASFSDEDMVTLYSAWSAYSWVFATFYIPGMALALLGGYILSGSVGGFIGNILAVMLLFAIPIFASVISRKRKKRYLACRDKLGLTDEDIHQALRHKKRGTVADAHPGS